MLNEIMQNERLRNRKLTDLYEKGLIELGDEIPYKHSEESYLSPKERNGYDDQSFSTKDVEMKWQAIGVEKKCLKLLAKRPVLKLCLQGARGCVYGMEELNAISRLFATGIGALEGKSITIEDVNQLLDVIVDEKEKRVYQIGRVANINATEKNNFLRAYILRSPCDTPGHYWLKDYNAYLDEYTVIQTEYSYYKYFIIGKKKEKKILFSKNKYWLASPGVYVNSIREMAFFGLGAVSYGRAGNGYSLFDSHGFWCARRLAVRPVLYLKPHVTLNVLLENRCKND